jgi:hypothetical protein
MIVRRIGKLIHTLLLHRHPRAVPEMLAHGGLQIVRRLENGFGHGGAEDNWD